MDDITPKDRFESAVKRFLMKYDIEPTLEGLKSIGEREDKVALLQAFMMDGNIRSYLTRDSHQVGFHLDKSIDEGKDVTSGDDVPLYLSPKYESEFEVAYYELCSKQEQTWIPYRAFQSAYRKGGRPVDTFGTVGAGDLEQQYLRKNNDKAERLHNALAGAAAEGVVVDAPKFNGDFLDSMNWLRRTQNPNYLDGDRRPPTNADGSPIVIGDTGYSVMIFNTGKTGTGRGHSFMQCAIIDNTTKEIKTILFVNTNTSRDSFNHYELRMNDDSYRGTQGYTPEGTWRHNGEVLFPEPFHIINCSLNLQIDEDDMNCTLYSTNLTQALLETFAYNPDLVKKLADNSWKERPDVKEAWETAKTKADAKLEEQRAKNIETRTNFLNHHKLPLENDPVIEAIRNYKQGEYHELCAKVNAMKEDEVEKDNTEYDIARWSNDMACYMEQAYHMELHRGFRVSDTIYNIGLEQASLLRADMLPNLDMYYTPTRGEDGNVTYEQRPPVETLEAHMHQRWDAGNTFIKDRAAELKAERTGVSTKGAA